MDITRLLASTALFLTLSTFHSGLARADSDGSSQTVRYRESELAQRDRAAALYARLRIAAESACRPLDGASLARRHDFASCRSIALDDAVRRVGSSQVSALHARRANSPDVWASR